MRFPLRRHVCAPAGLAVAAARPPAPGGPVPGSESAEPPSATQVPLTDTAIQGWKLKKRINVGYREIITLIFFFFK